MHKRIYARLNQKGVLPDVAAGVAVLAAEVCGDTVQIAEKYTQFATFSPISMV